MSTALERFNRLREKVQSYTDNRKALTDTISKLRVEAKAASATGDTHRSEMTQQKSLLTSQIPGKIAKALAVLELPATYFKTFQDVVTKELHRAIEHDLTSMRFSVLEAENKVMQLNQEIADKEAEVRKLDKEYKQHVKDFEKNKAELKKQRDEIAAKLNDTIIS